MGQEEEEGECRCSLGRGDLGDRRLEVSLVVRMFGGSEGKRLVATLEDG